MRLRRCETGIFRAPGSVPVCGAQWEGVERWGLSACLAKIALPCLVAAAVMGCSSLQPPVDHPAQLAFSSSAGSRTSRMAAEGSAATASQSRSSCEQSIDAQVGLGELSACSTVHGPSFHLQAACSQHPAAAHPANRLAVATDDVGSRHACGGPEGGRPAQRLCNTAAVQQKTSPPESWGRLVPLMHSPESALTCQVDDVLC